MTGPILRVRDLTTRFRSRAGTVTVVDGVSFTLDRGEVLGLVGESGSGKSMTGFSLIGLVDEPGRVEPTASVELDGRELVGLAEPEMRALRGRRISMVFQDPMMTLNPVLSIGDQMGLVIAAHHRMSRADMATRAAEALTRVGIPEARARLDAYPHQFSGGMRQRVAIAIAILNHPAVIIADEPTTALDVSIQAQILVELQRLAREDGTAMIWISHDLATVSTVADRVAVMYAGRIVEHGPTTAVLSRPRHPYTRGLLDSLPSRGEPGHDLAQIPGAPPSLAALPPGCAFAPRCGHADAACGVAPPATEVGPRGWRCHHPLEEARR
ncbi:ABC transporter ATP-binding protein [Siculibacillus lacustris]|uniref:ABC transporter ATP-binding protein n=1 Tax=Siculibacillus lacustris TaxID=1549641 RepID=A0A4Q9VYI6_9HYPH|nr:ABC transporter ATP-binding protein [Siculibacillus lacustris]TBW41184.1 ABC transporter ATP-binding protein [Siculibacillus lacustris]